MNLKFWFGGASALFVVFKPLVYMAIGLPLWFLLCRVFFVWYKADIIGDSYTWSQLLWSGFRIDVSSLGYLMTLLVLVFVIVAFISGYVKALVKPLKLGTALLCALLLAVVVIMEAATPGFLDEYGVRPNRFFVEYLKYPKEVTNLLLRGHLVEVIIALVLFLGTFTGTFIYFFKSFGFGKKIGVGLLLVVFVLGEAGAVLAARSTLGHRPLNPAMVAFSQNPLTNELTLNSTYSVIYAITRMKSGKSAIDYYGNMKTEVLVSRINGESCRKPAQFAPATKEAPTRSFNPAVIRRERPLNIVVLLQESFGAQFVKSLGGLDLAPNIDALAREGWFFTDAYATGTRSIRGIEGVVTGFLPTPLPAVLKQDRAQQFFFSLPNLLQAKGYDTSFIYGGETHFDNMKSFFLANGVKTIIGQEDYKNPAFVGAWGVSDEDLFNKVHEYFTKANASGMPFFSLVFSSSNHDPFEFPDGRIELYEQPKQTRNNAVKYADYALGEFIKKAKASSYWQNTIFLIIADHDSRVSGETLVPIKHFKIPALILGADIKPRRDDRIVSQIDMAPTLLSYAGVDAVYPMVGRDLNNDCGGGRAIMQYNQNFAYMWSDSNKTKHNVVIMTPGHEPQGFMLDKNNANWQSVTWPKDKLETARTWAIAGDVFYRRDFFSTRDGFLTKENPRLKLEPKSVTPNEVVATPNEASTLSNEKDTSAKHKTLNGRNK